MGLISELICKNSCQGQALPENIIFIAACNPYRQKYKKLNIDEKEICFDIQEIKNINNSKKDKLVYNVNPLSHSLLNFVLNFGNLSSQDEKDYIKYIIKDIINNIYYEKQIMNNIKEKKDEDNNLKKLKNLAKDMIIEAQNYIREFTDKSSVSLREIKRFNIFYEFFNKYLNTKKVMINEIIINKEDKEFYSKLNDYSIQIYSLILSIFISYYLKLTDKEKRNGFNERMNILLKKFDISFKDANFTDIPIKEEIFLIDNIKLEKEIEKNNNLKENIFASFVAINNKVPIFIIGKEGCNNSLYIQLLIKTMQGKLSDNPFFKKFPQILYYKYKGPLLNTSKEIENIFKNANITYQRLKKDREDEKIIFLILLDEMNLNMYSPNNPLKVILSELEYNQKRDNHIAFIGLSNGKIDFEKMNRGISIFISEQDEEENKEKSLKNEESFEQIPTFRNRIFSQKLYKFENF